MPNSAQILRRALIIAGVSCVIAVGVNATRPTPVAWVAQADYEIYEDCDETTESAERIELAEVAKNPSWYLIVDAREREPYEEWHLEGSCSLPYDPLFSVDAGTLDSLRSAAGDRTVVVVGDGDHAKLLADDLLSQGMTWVRFIDPDEDWRTLPVASAD